MPNKTLIGRDPLISSSLNFLLIASDSIIEKLNSSLRVVMMTFITFRAQSVTYCNKSSRLINLKSINLILQIINFKITGKEMLN